MLVPLTLISFFLNLGLQPIYMEEPRRALVAMEMILNGNYWVPTEFGIPYYNKPPLYNWLLCSVFNITGSYSEFNLRVISVVSFILLGFVHFIFTRKYMGLRFAAISSLLLLISVDIYFYFSLTGEIDLFYSLLVYCNIAVIYYFVDKQRYYVMFILAYFIAALGMLTKSFPSVLFLGISLLIALSLKKKLAKLFSLAHVAGFLVFAIVIASYLFVYSRMHDLDLLINGLWVDSSKRTVLEGAGNALLTQLVNFPLEVLKNMLPASLLLVFAFSSKNIRNSPFILFSLLIFLFNSLIYWISPDAKQRYIYALYPFLANVFLFLYDDTAKQWKETYLRVIGWIVVIGGLAGCVSIAFIPQFSGTGAIAIVSAAVAAFLLILHYRKTIHPLLMIAGMFVLLRMVFDLTVLPLRAHDEHASVRKHDGIEIARIAGKEPVYLFQNSHISNGMVYYIVRESLQPVNRVYNPELPGYFLIEEKYFDELDYTSYYESALRDVRFRLVKFK